MPTEMIIEFSKASGMLLAVSYLVSWIYHGFKINHLYRDVLVGGVIGLAALIGMMFPFQFSEGLFFDARTVVLGVGSAIGGPVVAGVSFVMAVTYRAWLGGVGALVGVSTISFAVLCGLASWYLVNKKHYKVTLLRTLALGYIIHIFSVLLFLTLPVPTVSFLTQISIPMLVVLPLATAVLYRMLYADIMWRESAASVVKVMSERDRALLQQSDALVQVIQAISLTIEKRDPYTAGHQQNVARLAELIARQLGWDEGRIKGLFLGASIHDLGKIYVPAEILNRPGKLTYHEFGIIQSHCEVGYDILKDISFPWPVAEMVLQHHERMDGSGYPKGLKGEQIIKEARIIAVADVVEAITSHRPYRPARGLKEGLKELKAGRGYRYDPEVVDACLEIINSGDFIFESSSFGVSKT